MADKHPNKRFDDLVKTVEKIGERISALAARIGRLETEISKPREQNETTRSPQGTSSGECDATERQSPSISQIQTSPENANQSLRPWYRTAEGWKTRLELVAIPFAIAYAIVTFFQWRDLRHNFVISERAWVSVPTNFYSDPLAKQLTCDDPTWEQRVPNKMFTGGAAVALINAGKSPVLQSKTEAWVQVLDRRSPPDLSFAGYHAIIAANVIFPGKCNIIEGIHRLHPTGGDYDLTDDESKLLENGDDYAVLYGFTDYTDRFGEHWTSFCGWWNYVGQKIPTGFNAKTCVDFNSMGDGPPPYLNASPKQ